MKVNNLLFGARIRPKPFKRNFTRFRSVKPERPLQYLTMDIKICSSAWHRQKRVAADDHGHL